MKYDSPKYKEICDTLGFRHEIHFVKVTNRGTITFTAGKPDEVRSLLAAVRSNGMTPAKSLINACAQN